jgi:endonuclease/exonuclease/phosphatase family metal-dependent hydrolase
MKVRIGTILLVFLMGCVPQRRPDFAPTEPNLKVITYNVNWGFVQPQRVVDFLAGADADIICLQETHSRWEAVLKARLGTRYPYCAFRDSPGAGGIAIMSRYRLRDVRVIEPNDGWFPAILADALTPVGEVQILNVHLRPPL